MQFQATCTKWSKKLTLTLKASDIKEARSILHAQWYSIIELHEIDESVELKNFFYFDTIIKWETQTWKIQSVDIFKAYKKLIEDLKYNVVYIYTTQWMPEDQKKILTAKVKDGYRLYRETLWEETKGFEKKSWNNIDDNDISGVSPEILQEIQKHATLVDSTLVKIQNIFLKYREIITPDHKRRLENVQNELIQVKWSKNLWKIKTTIEESLMLIGEIEVSLLKLWMTEEKKKFLQETNALLKQVWSKDRIQTEQQKKQSIEYKLSNFFKKIGSATKKTTTKAEKKDNHSFIYFKNKRELDIYKKKPFCYQQRNSKNLFQIMI